MNKEEYEEFKIEHKVLDKDITKILGMSIPILQRRKKNNELTLSKVNKLAINFNLIQSDILRIFVSDYYLLNYTPNLLKKQRKYCSSKYTTKKIRRLT